MENGDFRNKTTSLALLYYLNYKIIYIFIDDRILTYVLRISSRYRLQFMCEIGFFPSLGVHKRKLLLERA